MRSIAYVLLMGASALSLQSCKDKSPSKPADKPAAPTTPTPAPVATGSDTAPANPAPAKPTCGMASNPNMAKDRGKITIKFDGVEHCATFWNQMGFADGKGADRNMLWYSDKDLGSISMPGPDRKPMFETVPNETKMAIGINHSYKLNDSGDYLDVTVELGGFTKAEWQGVVKGDFAPKTMGYVMTPDSNKVKRGYLTGTLKTGGKSEPFSAVSGSVTFESYDFAKQAFKGHYTAKVAPIAGISDGGAEHTVEATFDIRTFD